MNHIISKITSDPKILNSFKESLVQLKKSLHAYESPHSGLSPDTIGNEFRKTLEIFVKVVHSEAQTSQSSLYDDLLYLTSDKELERQEFFSEGDTGFIKALLKFVLTLGNYSSHHQTEEHKQIDAEHIIMGRVAFYLLIKTYLSKHLEIEHYDFLQVKTPHNHIITPLSSTPNWRRYISKILIMVGLIGVGIFWWTSPPPQPKISLSPKEVSSKTTQIYRESSQLKQVTIAKEQQLKIILEHNLPSGKFNQAKEAAEVYASYRIALEKRNSKLAFPSFVKVLRCYYDISEMPRHELLKSKRWKSDPPIRKQIKSIYLRAESSVIGDHWVQLSTADEPRVEFGTGQIFVFEKVTDINTSTTKWLITAEYGKNYWKCAPKVKQDKLYWPKN